MTAFIRAGLAAAALLISASAALQAQTAPKPTSCPPTHYDCGPGVCCPKLGG